MKKPFQVEAHVYRTNSSESYEFLALQRTDKRGGFWQPVTGGLEDIDPNDFSAVVREIDEELGVPEEQIRGVMRLTHTFEFMGDDGRRLVERTFGVEVDPSTEVEIDGREHSRFCWGSIAKVRGLYKWEDNIRALDELGEHLGITGSV